MRDERGRVHRERTPCPSLRPSLALRGRRLLGTSSPGCTEAGCEAPREAESDIDVAVLVDDDHAATPSSIKDSYWRLAGTLGREVPSDRLDLVLLNDAPVLLRHRVIRDGVLLFARSETERVRFVLRTIREYQDLEPRLREHTRRRVERLKEGRVHGRYGDLLETARRAGRLLGPTAKSRVKRRSRNTSRSRGFTISPRAIFTLRPKRQSISPITG